MFTESTLFTSVAESNLSFFKQLSKKDWLIVGCMCSGFIFVIAGIVLLLFKGETVTASSTSVATNNFEQQLYVDVSGAVAHPGIYMVLSDDRVAAAIRAAGGIIETADNEYIAESLNLAKTLSDGEKIFIPFKELALSSNVDSLSENTTTTSNSLVSINTATESQLNQLPKVGDVTAQKIIQGRPYSAINELLEKKIVNTSVWTEISSLIKI